MNHYDEKAKEYNDVMNVLTNGNFTPISRKKEHQKEMAEYRSNMQTNSNASNTVGADSIRPYTPSYGGVPDESKQSKSPFVEWNIEKTQPKLSYGVERLIQSANPSRNPWLDVTLKNYATRQGVSNIDKPAASGYNENAEWDKPTYSDWDNSHTVIPRLSGNYAGIPERGSSTSIYDSIHSDMARYEPQAQPYRPGEGFIKKPEKLFLSADEKKNVKLEQLPYKPTEHKGEYEQYSNQPTDFGELKLAYNNMVARAGTYEVGMLGQSKSNTPKGDERFSEDVRYEISLFQQIWLDAEFSYSAGIIDIYEKEAVQSEAHNRAEEIRYRADNPYKSFFSDAAEYVIFDLSDLGDISYGTVYAADLTGPALQKMYGNADNLKKIIDAGVAAGSTVYATSKGKSIGAVKIDGQVVHVDIEYPQGGKPANLHVQVKGKKGKTMITSMDDISELPKGLRKNRALIDIIERGLENINKLF